MGRIGIENNLTVECRKQRMQQHQGITARVGAYCLGEIDDSTVSLRQWRFPQKELWWEPLDRVIHEAICILGVDFAGHFDGQFVERAIGCKRVDDISESILMLMQQAILRQIDTPRYNMLTFMVARG